MNDKWLREIKKSWRSPDTINLMLEILKEMESPILGDRKIKDE